jgi:hypothetical protein
MFLTDESHEKAEHDPHEKEPQAPASNLVVTPATFRTPASYRSANQAILPRRSQKQVLPTGRRYLHPHPPIQNPPLSTTLHMGAAAATGRH